LEAPGRLVNVKTGYISLEGEVDTGGREVTNRKRAKTRAGGKAKSQVIESWVHNDGTERERRE